MGLKIFAEEFARVRLADLDRVTARGWALRHPQSNVRVVRAMFNDAINDGLHPGPNPFANLRLEQPRGRKDLIALTRDELHELADKAIAVHDEFGPVFRAMILFAGYVGLRPGEMFALERSDVGRDEVTIRRNLDGTGTLKLPKNDQERVVVLPPPAREALAAVPARLDVPWPFVTPRGRQFRKGSLHYTGTRYGLRSGGRVWTSTSCATSRDAPARAGRVACGRGGATRAHGRGRACHVHVRSSLRGSGSRTSQAGLCTERDAAAGGGGWVAEGTQGRLTMALLSGSSPPSNPPPPLLIFGALRGPVPFSLLFWRRLWVSPVGSVSKPIRAPAYVATIFQYESLRITWPSRKVHRSQPRTSTRSPSVVVPVSVHSETPLVPLTQCESSP
jgi:integrase